MNTKKNLTRFLTVTALILSIGLAYADDKADEGKPPVGKGGIGSGGGGEIHSRFVRAMHDVVKRIEDMDQDTVETRRLRSTLRNVNVVVTSTLKDPATGRSIEDQEYLYAYGSPGLIQLKPIWKEYLDSHDAGVTRRDHDIAHELFRATGINDDGYRYSITELALHDRPRPAQPLKLAPGWKYVKRLTCRAPNEMKYRVNILDREEESRFSSAPLQSRHLFFEEIAKDDPADIVRGNVLYSGSPGTRFRIGTAAGWHEDINHWDASLEINYRGDGSTEIRGRASTFFAMEKGTIQLVYDKNGNGSLEFEFTETHSNLARRELGSKKLTGLSCVERRTE